MRSAFSGIGVDAQAIRWARTSLEIIKFFSRRDDIALRSE
jgi:hypothetical protein